MAVCLVTLAYKFFPSIENPVLSEVVWQVWAFVLGMNFTGIWVRMILCLV